MAKHDPDCAITLDVALTADEDDPKYKPKACTCKARQRERKNAAERRARRLRGGRSGALEGMERIGEGCYITPIRWIPGQDG